MLELPRRKFLVRAGLVLAAAPMLVRASSLMKIVAPRLNKPSPLLRWGEEWTICAIAPSVSMDPDVMMVTTGHGINELGYIQVVLGRGYKVGEVIDVNKVSWPEGRELA